LLTLLEKSITKQLSKDLPTLKAFQMDKIIRERDTLGFLALIRTQSLELSTKSKMQLRQKRVALRQKHVEKATEFLKRFERV
jgi:hypothetical protein